METSFCFLLFQLFHLFQPAQRCLLHCSSPLHSSRYVSRIKRRGMKLTCRATREREKERGWLLNVQATTRNSKFGRERTVSFDGMACDGRIRDPFLLPRGIPRNEGEGRGGGDLADAIYAARFLFPGSHTCWPRSVFPAGLGAKSERRCINSPTRAA